MSSTAARSASSLLRAGPIQNEAASIPYVTACARPSIRLSITVRFSNSSMFWNVRAMPAAAFLCGRRPRMSSPRKLTLPSCGL